MIKDTLFYTATMAKVYADQGELGKACEIYRYILEQEPDRMDVADALSEIEKKLPEKRKALVNLISIWTELFLKYNNLEKLKKFRIKADIKNEK